LVVLSNHPIAAQKDSINSSKALALRCGDVKLTYQQLDERANRLAHFLRKKHSLVPGVRVGILLERSVETYISLLAVLKCGAAFVPLDLAFPSDRLAFTTEDAATTVLVTMTTHVEMASSVTCTVLALDDEKEAIYQQPSSRPIVRDSDDTLSYIIYTSGTTGRPKGVAINQSSICNFISVVTPLYGVTPNDSVYQGMTIAFDFSMEEIWPTFAIGATLVPGPTDHRRLGPDLAQFLEKEKVTVLHCCPTLLSTIDRDLPSLRVINVGGEACPEDLVRRWSPGRLMLNTYGPTETTVTASMGQLIPGRKLTIGKPLPTYTIRLLDEKLQPVPQGELGEIFIGGKGVAEGYINRPNMTELRFLQNHLEPGRTGDMGRLTSEGEIEYCGRIDSQVKILGYRIELSEIESVILENVSAAAAIVDAATIGNVKELVAYVVVRQEACVSVDELKVQLSTEMRNRLPRYMVPSFIEVVDFIPTLPSGKADRKKLPPPTTMVSACSGTPPSTPLEKQIAAAWGSVFWLETVSVEADFFTDLGGHSLAAAQVVSMLRKDPALQHIPISDIYAYPTVRSLANHLEMLAEQNAAGRGGTEIGHDEKHNESIRHTNAAVWTCGIVQFIFIYAFLMFFAIPFAYLLVVGVHPLFALGIQTVGMLPVTLVLPPIVKWLLIGRYRSGRYRLWGWYYVRWWISKKVILLSPIRLLAGSPFLALWMRLLGARIGKGCHLGSERLQLPDLIEIEDGASIGYNVALETYVIKDGWLYQAPIKIGKNACICNNSVIMLGGYIGDSAVLLEQTLVAENQCIPDNETWAGSPSRKVEGDVALTDMSLQLAPQEWSTGMKVGFFVLLVFFLMILPAIMVTPSGCIMWYLAHGDMRLITFYSPLGGVVFVISTCFFVALFKRIILYRTPQGIFPLRSWLGMRKWATDNLMVISLTFTNSLYATLYTSPWLRALGAKVGPRSEVSTVSHIDPDLLVLGAESFVADIAVVGAARHHHGWIYTGKTEVGYRSFIGNAAVVPPGTHLADNCLVGVLSSPPLTKQTEPGTSWLGSPAIYLPRRQESEKFSDGVTFHPPYHRIATRLSIEFLRVVLPSVLLLISLSAAARLVYWLFEEDVFESFWVLAAITPGIYLGAMLVMYLVIVALKWLVIGRYPYPHVAPLWSHFVWRSELITALYESAAVPGLLATFQGTPFLPPLLRMLGARVGARVYLETTFLTEFDLVRVGDDAAVGFHCSLQTHLFEDRVMKMSLVRVGHGASIGPRSIVLYDSSMEDGASLDALSLVMKGERIPANTEWRGIPAQFLSHCVKWPVDVPMGNMSKQIECHKRTCIPLEDQEDQDPELAQASSPTASCCGAGSWPPWCTEDGKKKVSWRGSVAPTLINAPPDGITQNSGSTEVSVSRDPKRETRTTSLQFL
jgi:non-ribosomal peptide synthetase-like protein